MLISRLIAHQLNHFSPMGSGIVYKAHKGSIIVGAWAGAILVPSLLMETLAFDFEVIDFEKRPISSIAIMPLSIVGGLFAGAVAGGASGFVFHAPLITYAVAKKYFSSKSGVAGA